MNRRDRPAVARPLVHSERSALTPVVRCVPMNYSPRAQGAQAAELQALRSLLGNTAAYQYAEIYAQWSQPSAAVQWLQTAYRLHDSRLGDLKSDSLLDPIRSSPQYHDIERRLNLPHNSVWPVEFA